MLGNLQNTILQVTILLTIMIRRESLRIIHIYFVSCIIFTICISSSISRKHTEGHLILHTTLVLWRNGLYPKMCK